MEAMATEKLGEVRSAFLPQAPDNLKDLGIPESLVEDLMLRRLHTEGTSRIKSLCNSFKLSLPVIQAVFERLRKQQLFEVKGLDGNDYSFTLSGPGRELAEKRFNIC